MAITTKLEGTPAVGRFSTAVEVSFPSSYAQEEPFTASIAGLQTLDRVVCHILSGDEAKSSEQFIGFCIYKKTNETSGKLQLINLKTGKEVEAAKNTEKVKVLCVCSGKARSK